MIKIDVLAGLHAWDSMITGRASSMLEFRLSSLLYRLLFIYIALYMYICSICVYVYI